MCVIYFAFLQRDDFPFILLANRDEFYDRPTAPATRWDDAPHIFAGRDLVADGTWLGITDSGRFAAVTNYRDPSAEKGNRSRGELVAGFLRSDVSAGYYMNQVQGNAAEYSGFNLIVGEVSSTARELLYFSNRGSSVQRLGPGIYGLSNHLLDTEWPKLLLGKERFHELLKEEVLPREKFFELLADDALAGDAELPETGIGYEREKLLSAIFIRSPIYGTRSSTILTIDAVFTAELDERVFV
jgi:uncharacterized protein with NRDE domain